MVRWSYVNVLPNSELGVIVTMDHFSPGDLVKLNVEVAQLVPLYVTNALNDSKKHARLLTSDEDVFIVVCIDTTYDGEMPVFTMCKVIVPGQPVGWVMVDELANV